MKPMLTLLASLCCVSLLCAQQQQPITIQSGKISGVAAESADVIVYKGIPYAAPPVGDLRWKAPQPPQNWTGVRRCDQFGAASLQADREPGTFYWKEFYQDGDPERSEDCLYLNVWAPADAQGKKLPVMVWIHGGAYTGGFGHEIEFSGNAIAQKEVILVTLNYRLGVCGFLAHPLLTAENGGKGSGNWGLLDQLAALQWVHNNIATFGGNPENVTLFGQSAGAGSVQALISSALSEGLIHRAIIQSGGGLGGLIAAAPLSEAEAVGKALFDDAGITTLEAMRAMPASEFDQLVAGYQQKHQAYLPFRPCIDGVLLTESMDETALAGKTLDIPYMIGYTSEDIAPQLMLKAATDWSLWQEKSGRTPTYVYCFAHDLPGDDMTGDELKGAFGDMKGAFHSAELWYVFGTLDKCWRPMTADDQALSDQIVTYWTNFAKTGNPNSNSWPAWQPYTEKNPEIRTLIVEQQ